MILIGPLLRFYTEVPRLSFLSNTRRRHFRHTDQASVSHSFLTLRNTLTYFQHLYVIKYTFYEHFND